MGPAGPLAGYASGTTLGIPNARSSKPGDATVAYRVERCPTGATK